jgi:solute carrier family 25 iron transporter 28/37
MFTSYGICQKSFNPKSEYNPSAHFLSGAIAGGVGCIVTMPLDVCKTLLNTQEAGVLRQIGQTEVTGLYGAASVVNQVTGMRGFFQVTYHFNAINLLYVT